MIREVTAATRNSGARAARGEWLFFVDADTRIHAGAVASALRHMKKGAVGGGVPAWFDRNEIVPLYGKLLGWLLAFFSPTAYFLVLLFVARHPMPYRLPETLVAALFCLIPVVALLTCEALVWSARMRVRWKIAALVLTLSASVLQAVVLVVVLRIILITAIAYP
ncbi:MAG TPA: glycosyltransferase family A protein [Lacipirellulaceae bacterium]|nr:glycosyltransferase family A protein [Lacipirellulaceae bacterium]